ncbi:unnamed protein product [Arctia plantaginis]|uniref:Endoplasmic reticulum transmembrane protein n=1 Tax=Arctia plantaginis TaxID=874455 RepID=A0A8S1BQ53_ARCPL|nr:unnamed protein product [Arctia plantaginis]CAB3260514.1 unnamed protein product [Arctia plantaginis]
MKGNVKLFRAQRNFYITGFAIFLAFVIRRLVTMLIIQDELSMKAEKIIKEAEATVNLAKTTVLANTLNASEQNYDDMKEKLELKEDLLRAEHSRIRELEGEILKWKTKYEEAIATVSVGKGDE